MASSVSGSSPASRRALSAGTTTLELDLSPPDEGQGEMRQRGEVARRTDAALLGDDRVDPRAEEVEQPVHDDRPAAAVAEGERVRAEEQHRPDDLAREGRPDARRVAHQQVLLEPARVGGGDHGRGERPEPGRHAIDDRALGDEGFDEVAGLLDPFASVAIERDVGVAACDRLDVGHGQVGAGQDHERRSPAAGSGRARRARATLRVEVRDLRLAHRAEDSRLCCRAPTPAASEVRVLAFIDQIVIPFLNSLYGAVGYAGVLLAMAIESAMIPLPSELILPYAGFLVSDTSQLEPLSGAAWNFWIVVVVATIGNTLGSLVAYAIGAYGGRPFLQRYGKYLLIRPHEIELADAFFADHGGATVFIGRLLPIVRTFISFPAGVARMPIGRFVVYSTAGALLWSIVLVYAGTVLGANWKQIREALQPFDLAIAVAVVIAVVAFVWWRLGMPGRPGRPSGDAGGMEG